MQLHNTTSCDAKIVEEIKLTFSGSITLRVNCDPVMIEGCFLQTRIWCECTIEEVGWVFGEISD